MLAITALNDPKNLVRKGRLELPRVAPLDPKSSASTNSATFALPTRPPTADKQRGVAHQPRAGKPCASTSIAGIRGCPGARLDSMRLFYRKMSDANHARLYAGRCGQIKRRTARQCYSSSMLKRARPVPERLTRHGYWLAAAVPLLLPLGWALREAPGMHTLFAWLSLPLLYLVLPALDLAIGRDLHNPSLDGPPAYPNTLLPLVASVSYLAVLVWALYTLSAHPQAFGPLALLGWTLSLANLGGVVAINVAHELIHRREKALQNLGGLLLACVCYACFKLEHPRWHHVKVATPDDPSSAPRGSSVYARAPRAWLLNTPLRLAAGQPGGTRCRPSAAGAEPRDDAPGMRSAPCWRCCSACGWARWRRPCSWPTAWARRCCWR